MISWLLYPLLLPACFACVLSGRRATTQQETMGTSVLIQQPAWCSHVLHLVCSRLHARRVTHVISLCRYPTNRAAMLSRVLRQGSAIWLYVIWVVHVASSCSLVQCIMGTHDDTACLTNVCRTHQTHSVEGSVCNVCCHAA